MRARLGVSLGPDGSETSLSNDVSVAWVSGVDSWPIVDGECLGRAESFPRTIGAGGQLLVGNAESRGSTLEPAMGCAG